MLKNRVKRRLHVSVVRLPRVHWYKLIWNWFFDCLSEYWYFCHFFCFTISQKKLTLKKNGDFKGRFSSKTGSGSRESEETRNDCKGGKKLSVFRYLKKRRATRSNLTAFFEYKNKITVEIDKLNKVTFCDDFFYEFFQNNNLKCFF